METTVTVNENLLKIVILFLEKIDILTESERKIISTTIHLIQTPAYIVS